MSNELKDYIMNTKDLSSKLSKLACCLTDDEFIHADIVVCSDRIHLENWTGALITSPALRHIIDLSDSCNLFMYVDYDAKRVVIHG